MAALDTIRAALQTALAGVTGLEAYEYAPGDLTVPAAVVAPDSIEYDADFEHGADYRLPVQMLVGLGDWESAQKAMDAMVAHDGTAVTAINTASSIEARVVSLTEYGLTNYGDKTYLGAVLIVSVLAG